MGFPSTATLPSVGFEIPVKISTTVLFPEAVWPIIPIFCPFDISNFTLEISKFFEFGYWNFLISTKTFLLKQNSSLEGWDSFLKLFNSLYKTFITGW